MAFTTKMEAKFLSTLTGEYQRGDNVGQQIPKNAATLLWAL